MFEYVDQRQEFIQDLSMELCFSFQGKTLKSPSPQDAALLSFPPLPLWWPFYLVAVTLNT